MRRRQIIYGLIFAVAVALFAVWRVRYHGIDPRLILWPPAEDSIAEPAELDEPAEIDVEKIPLGRAVAQLAKRHNVSIELDSFALQDLSLRGNEPVSCRLSGVKLKSVLAALGNEFALEVRYREGAIYLTTADAWHGRLQNYVGRVYRLDRLLAAPLSPVDEDDLATIVRSHISPSTWNDAGGKGILRTIPGSLVVSQTPDVQRDIAALFDRLAEIFESGDPPSRVRLHPTDGGSEAVLKALDAPTEMNAVNLPFKDLCTELSRRHGVAIIFDTKALDGVGASAENPIRLAVKDISLRSALSIVCDSQSQTFVIRDDSLFVTTPEVADNMQSTCLYPVGDLVSTAKGADYDTLIDLLTTIVAPTTWDDAGGAGSTRGFGGVLVISQTEDVHAQIESLLEELRRARLPAGLAGPARRHKSTERLERALAQSVSFDFDQVPLPEVASRLSKECGINVLLDTRHLEWEGVRTDVPITFKADKIPLEQAVRQMLATVNLAPLVRWESLIFTVPEVAGNYLETRCYRVAELFGSAISAVGPDMYDSDYLIDFVTSVADPRDWEDAGGAGSISAFESLLVVSQIRESHETLAKLLGHLRRANLGPSIGEVSLLARSTSDRPAMIGLYDVRDLKQLLTDDYPSLADSLAETFSPETEYDSANKQVMGALGQHRDVVGVWGPPALQSRASELLAGLRRASKSPASPEPVLTGPVVEGRLTAIYQIADLRRAAGWRKTPFSGFDASHGYLMGMQGLRFEYYTHYPAWRPDPLTKGFEDCLNSAERENKFAFGHAALGDLLVIHADPSTRLQIESFFSNLRRLLIEGAPFDETSLMAAGESSIISLRDLRPILRQFPELDEPQIAKFIEHMNWHVSFSKLTHTLPLVTLPGGLVFGPPFEAARIDATLDMLVRRTGDLPRPADLAHDEDRPAQLRLAALIPAEQDEFRLAWLLWLANQARHRQPELVEAIHKRLAGYPLDATLSRAARFQAYAELTALGPAASDFCSRLLIRLDEIDNSTDEEEERQCVAETLVSLGIKGQVALCRWGATPGNDPSRNIIRAVRYKPTIWPQLIVELLAMLSDPSLDRTKLKQMIQEMDRHGDRTRKIHQTWSKSEDPELRKLAKTIEAELLNNPGFFWGPNVVGSS